jgi:coenzyme Q-binding protein COQ10
MRIAKRIGHPWEDLFNLVLDLELYPAFVPHCRDVQLISRKLDDFGRTIIVSRMTVGLSALQVSYVNRTVGDFGERQIRVDSLDGPVRYLAVVWKFNPEGNYCTKVEFSASYEFSNPILTAVASRLLHSMSSEIVTAFERRADRFFKQAV